MNVREAMCDLQSQVLNLALVIAKLSLLVHENIVQKEEMCVHLSFWAEL